ncbi:hypothetical protein A9Q77_03570, partial [Marinomonas sp. 42_23_T18]
MCLGLIIEALSPLSLGNKGFIQFFYNNFLKETLMNTALFDRLSAVQADLVVTLVPSEAALPQSTSWVDENTAGLISQLRESKVFSGKLAETLLLPVASQDYAQAVLLVG